MKRARRGPDGVTAGLCAAIALLPWLSACRPPGPHGERTIRDGLGRTVSVPETPRRVVSLAPSVTVR